MVFEGDFAAGQHRGDQGQDRHRRQGRSRSRRSATRRPVVTGGDAAVALKDTKGAQALLTCLASTDAAKIWAGRAASSRPTRRLDLGAYPNDVQRAIAKALIAAGDNFRFDMSDQAPQSFGGTPGKGEWKDLQDFLKNPTDVAGTQPSWRPTRPTAFKN